MKNSQNSFYSQGSNNSSHDTDDKPRHEIENDCENSEQQRFVVNGTKKRHPCEITKDLNEPEKSPLFYVSKYFKKVRDSTEYIKE